MLFKEKRKKKKKEGLRGLQKLIVRKHLDRFVLVLNCPVVFKQVSYSEI